MICGNCGGENDDKAEFCIYCGAQLLPRKVKKKRFKLIAAISGIAALIVVLVVGIWFTYRTTRQNKYDETVKKAERYLAEADYDSAISACNQAIELDEKNEDAYIQLAYAYNAMGDMQSVDEILTNGYQKTGSARIKRMMQNMVYYGSIFENGATTATENALYITNDDKTADEEPVLNTELLSELTESGYEDYTSGYTLDKVKLENGSDLSSVRFVDSDIVLWYANSGERQIIDTSSGVPLSNVVPSYITMKCSSILCDADIEEVDYKQVCEMFNEEPSIKEQGDRMYMVVHYMGCDIYIDCDESGNVVSATDGNIRIVPPNAGENKNENDNSGILSGKVINVSDGVGIESVTLSFRQDFDNKDGDVIEECTTDEGGAYTITLPQGDYTVCAEMDGYKTEYYEASVVCGETSSQNFTMTELLGTGEVRIVLEWGETPRDLDAHLFGTVDGDSFHVSFVDMTYGDLVSLDTDDRSSYGPETITISDISEGTFTYAVHNYSQDGSLAASEATVKVYMGNESEPIVYTVPSGDGYYWEVFKIENGQLTDINQIISDAVCF